jgi:hypothetical protein
LIGKKQAISNFNWRLARVGVGQELLATFAIFFWYADIVILSFLGQCGDGFAPRRRFAIE